MALHWLTRVLNKFRSARQTSGRRNGYLDTLTLKRLVEGVISTRPDEIGCDECFEELDRFAELVLAGREIPEAYRLVQDHLERCGDCREEFEALLEALRALNGSGEAH